MLVPFPAKAEVKREVGLDAPIVLTIEGQVILSKVEVEWTIGERELAADSIPICCGIRGWTVRRTSNEITKRAGGRRYDVPRSVLDVWT